MASYTFGVEIEIIAVPHTIRANLQSLTAAYYRKIAAALKVRGLQAGSNPLTPSADGRTPASYDKWWITRDGSLIIQPSDAARLVAIEAVSPILSTSEDWQREIDKFWEGFHAVFHTPTPSPLCGSHYHISRGRNTSFTLGELKTIAFGVVLFESQLTKILVQQRRTNQYCTPNTASSAALKRAVSHSVGYLAATINSVRDTTSLCRLMQANRYVLWNFANIVPGKSGTIEFRGGRCLRGKFRTRAWVAFTVSFIHWLLKTNHIANLDRSWDGSVSGLYANVQNAAQQLGLNDELPPYYTNLNETTFWR
ncbi:swim zinc finger domain protein [Ophiostoma piceae UAMH 11346]|uniref:Swim zinc finger domain protein n=1 Tax=Ophiostoma piceae (strain UAMH 11346) TaxID=1262450 RepID=S3C7Y7_OPHP1|nr:swim zinc finger domain protein [Ophiostoma piceae UAMH 11346]